MQDLVDAGYTVIAPDLFGHGAIGKAEGRLLARRLRERRP